MDYTPIIAPWVSQLSLLCDRPVTHPAIEYIIPRCAIIVIIIRHYFSEQGVREEPTYGVVDVSHEIDEDKVYGRLVDLRPSIKVSVHMQTHKAFYYVVILLG